MDRKQISESKAALAALDRQASTVLAKMRCIKRLADELPSIDDLTALERSFVSTESSMRTIVELIASVNGSLREARELTGVEFKAADKSSAE